MTLGAGPRARLSTANLTRARATIPDYNRTLPAGIVHIGVGAFARAHLGVYADDLARLGERGLVHGVSLRSRRAENQLMPQDCLYTVAERERGGHEPLRIIGSITSVATGPAAALRVLAEPEVCLVTVTITEKGYDLPHDDLVHPDRPTSAPGVLALALARRRDDGLAPPVVASMDNVLANGSVLRRRVADVASRLDPTLADWINERVAFPSSVVDRMVPASNEDERRKVEARLGLVDFAAVTTEHHRSWVMTAEDGFPALAQIGVELVEDIAPYEHRKLWLLNGPHSALAYCGMLAGCTTIAEAAEHPVIASFTQGLVDDVLEVARLRADLLPGTLDPHGYAIETLRRFRNPALIHTCVQVAADGSRKLPQRFAQIVQARHERGLGCHRFASVVAIWVAAVAGVEVAGALLPRVEDPEGPRFRAAGCTRRELVRIALEECFDERFVGEVADALECLHRDGMASLDAQA